MIYAVYDKNKRLLCVQGHACSAQRGRDLICAAASILVYTLAANVQYLEQCGYTQQTICELSEGAAQIGVTPRQGYESAVSMIFGAICVGLELLAKDHSDHITYEVIPENDGV